MADWDNVQPDVYALIDCDFTPGRDGSIQAITLHHNAGDLSIQDCHDLWERSETSAHYQVQSDGTIGQLVNDSDTAWACGNWWANSNTISIEHANDSSDPWTVWPAAVDSGAHLVAALCRYYGLGEPEWMVNVFPHSHWSSTACPGELAGSQNEDYMARAKWYYDNLEGDYDAEHGGSDDEGDDDMQLTDMITDGTIMGETSDASVGNCIYWAEQNTEKLLVQVEALTAAVEALAKAQGADPEAIASAVQDAVKAKLDGLKLTIQAG